MSDFSHTKAFDALIASAPFSSDCAGIEAITLSDRSAVLRVSGRDDLADRRRSRPVMMSLIDLAMRAALLTEDRFHERALASSIRMDFFDELPAEAMIATCSVIDCDDRYVGRISITPEAHQDRVSCVATCTFIR